MKSLLDPNPRRNACVYLPDDRTIVFDQEASIQKLLNEENPLAPAYVADMETDRFSRGIIAIAINNRNREFANNYDLGLPDDALALSLFNGVDRWTLGVEDDDAVVLHAIAACHDGGSVETMRALSNHW